MLAKLDDLLYGGAAMAQVVQRIVSGVADSHVSVQTHDGNRAVILASRGRSVGAMGHIRGSRCVQAAMHAVLLTVLGFSAASGNDESTYLQQTIQLRGLPKDEVPVVTTVSIHPTLDLLATAGDDHRVRIWGVKTGQLLGTLRGHSDWVTCVSFCSGGATLVTGGRDRQLLVWDLTNPSRGIPLGKHRGPISNIAVSPSGKRVAVAGFRTPLKVFDIESRECIQTLSCACEDTRALAFSPNGAWLAAAGRNGIVRVWDFTTGETFDLPGHKRRVAAVVFASDSCLLSAGEEQLIGCWDLTRRERQRSLRFDGGKVMALTMIDEHRLAIATAQNEIVLFDLRNETPTLALKGHTGSVAAIVARNENLISGSFDTTIRVWRIPDDELDNQARRNEGWVPLSLGGPAGEGAGARRGFATVQVMRPRKSFKGDDVTNAALHSAERTDPLSIGKR